MPGAAAKRTTVKTIRLWLDDGESHTKPFLEHLEDLRRTILWCAALFLVGVLLAIPLAPPVLALLKQPLTEAELEQIHGVGPKMARSVAAYLRREANREVLRQLLEAHRLGHSLGVGEHDVTHHHGAENVRLPVGVRDDPLPP